MTCGKPFELEPLWEEWPSTNSSQSTDITFINGTQKTRISVLWIDWNGHAQHYADVDAGQSNKRPTYKGHVWRVMEAESKRLIAGFSAVEETSVVTITDGMQAFTRPILQPLKPLSQEVMSPSSSTATSITFINNTEHRISVYWIDFQGHAKHYVDVEPKESNLRPTYVGHVWRVVRSATQKTIAVFSATPGVSTAIINGDLLNRSESC